MGGRGQGNEPDDIGVMTGSDPEGGGARGKQQGDDEVMTDTVPEGGGAKDKDPTGPISRSVKIL